MRLQRGDFGVGVLRQQVAAVPAADAIELIRCERGPERRGFARKFAAEFDTLEADFLAILQDRLKRRVAAEFGHIVVGPRDRADAEADAHRLVSFGLILSSYAARASRTAARSETSGTAT